MTNKERKQLRLAKAKFRATHTYFAVDLDNIEDAQLITYLEKRSNKSDTIRKMLREAFCLRKEKKT